MSTVTTPLLTVGRVADVCERAGLRREGEGWRDDAVIVEATTTSCAPLDRGDDRPMYSIWVMAADDHRREHLSESASAHLLRATIADVREETLRRAPIDLAEVRYALECLADEVEAEPAGGTWPRPRAKIGEALRRCVAALEEDAPDDALTRGPTGAIVRAFVTSRYGAAGMFMQVAKLAAEAGEALDAGVKLEEGRTDGDFLAELRGELGDVEIVLRGLFYTLGWNRDEVAAEKWAEVSAR